MPLIKLTNTEPLKLKLADRGFVKIYPGAEILVNEKEAADLMASGAFELATFKAVPKQESKKAEPAGKTPGKLAEPVSTKKEKDKTSKGRK